MFPILYQNHNFILYSYPLFMGLGWGVGYQIFFHQTDLSYIRSQFLFWGLFLSAWIGSKLFFILTSQSYSPELLQNLSFWTGGGFVFYGGLLTALLFLLICKGLKFKLTQVTVWNLLLSLSVGHALGRLGCFLAGCCYGHKTSLPWGVWMHGEHRHPTQLIEALGLFGLAWFLKQKGPGAKSLIIYFLFYGTLRLLVESLRADTIRGQWGFLTPSQWISSSLILLGSILWVRSRRKLFI
jgi:phosphatidylglycerol:prolipoprotein diacylglycerol transferase